MGSTFSAEIRPQGIVGRDVHQDEAIITHFRGIRAFDRRELKLEAASGIMVGGGRPFLVPMEGTALVYAVDRGGSIAERKFYGSPDNAKGAGGIRRYNEV